MSTRTRKPAGSGHGLAPGRKLAEWASLGASGLLVLGLAGFLVYQAVIGEPEYVPASVVPLPEQARAVGERYVLAVEVRNHGRRALRAFNGELRWQGADGSPQRRGFTIDALGGRTTRMVYLYLDEDPRGLRLTAAPLDYLLD